MPPLPAVQPTQAATLPQRAETGPLAFGNDWPGVFIRGDDALGYAMALRASKIENGIVNELIELFEACRK